MEDEYLSMKKFKRQNSRAGRLSSRAGVLAKKAGKHLVTGTKFAGSQAVKGAKSPKTKKTLKMVGKAVTKFIDGDKKINNDFFGNSERLTFDSSKRRNKR